MSNQQDIESAYQLAVEVRRNAHAPYSKYRVGAAVKMVGIEKLYAGCNVENSSFGATVCAERNAIFAAIADSGATEIEFLILVTDNEEPATPCGMCLQVISEFAVAETSIYLANLEKEKQKKTVKRLSFSEFLPRAFAKEQLPDFTRGEK